MSQEIKDTQATNKTEDLDTVVTVDKSKNPKKTIAAIGVAVVLILAVVISVLAVSGNSGKKLQKQLNLGNKYLEEMDYEQAKYAFQAALEIDPKNADAYEGLLKLYAAEQDAQGIADTYLQAAEHLTGEDLDLVQKNAAEQLEMLVKEALNLGEYDRAENYANLLAQVDAAKAENLRTQISQAKAEAERLAREQAEAEAERLAQEQAQAQLDLGNKYLDEMNYEQAIEAFNTVLEIDPKNADAYLGIVEVYIRTNDFETALEMAKKGYEVTGDDRLKEKIDMIESGNILASNGWNMKLSGCDENGNLVYWHEYTYNSKGQKDSITKYNANGVVEEFLELTYDEKGRPLVGYVYFSKNGNFNKKVYEYSDHHVKVTQYAKLENRVLGYFEIDLDDDDNYIKSVYHKENGEVRNITTYEYDEQGNIMMMCLYNKDGSLDSRDVYSYDEEGRLLKLQVLEANGEMRSYTEYLYDEEGNRIGYCVYDGDGSLTSEVRYE